MIFNELMAWKWQDTQEKRSDINNVFAKSVQSGKSYREIDAKYTEFENDKLIETQTHVRSQRTRKVSSRQANYEVLP